MKNLVDNRKHDICFHKGGTIDITSHVVQALGLREGDVISVCQTDNDYPEYYLFVRIPREKAAGGRYEARITRTVQQGRRSKFMRAYSRQLCQAICEIVGNNVAYLMTGELRTDIPGIERALTLITRTNLKPNK